MLDIKMYPFPLIWLESWSHTMKGMIEDNYQTNRSEQYHVKKIAWLDWPKTAKHFSVNSGGKFLSWHEANRRASKWISPLRQILFILLGSYFDDRCCTFHLGQIFIRFLSIIFDIYWRLVQQLSCITVRLSDHMFPFPLASD